MPLAQIYLTLSHHFSLSFIASGRVQGHIPNPHIAAECMFELVVLLLPDNMWGSIGAHHLWARPCFSSSVLHVWTTIFIYIYVCVCVYVCVLDRTSEKLTVTKHCWFCVYASLTLLQNWYLRSWRHLATTSNILLSRFQISGNSMI